MRLKLTLLRDDDARDIVVTTDSTATVEDVAREIHAADPRQLVPVDDEQVLTLAVAPPTQSELVPLPFDVKIGDAALGSGFTAQVISTGTNRARRSVTRTADAVAVLRVVSGPDAGREFQIHRGAVTIGRSAGNDIVLADRQVSKQHARFDVGAVIELIDLNSANGIVVDGGRVQRLRVLEGERFTLGGTELAMHFVANFDDLGDDPVLERGGSLMFNRSPRLEPRYEGEELKAPQYPREDTSQMFPWAMLAAPVLLGGGLFLFTNNPRSLMIMLLFPIMMLGNYLMQRLRLGKSFRRQQQNFERRYEELEERLYLETPKETAARDAEAPAVAEVFDGAMTLGELLWTRRPEHWNFLGLRLGTATQESRNTIGETNEEADVLPEYVERVDRLRERYRTIENVPVFESLVSCGVVGIAGSRMHAGDVMRGLLTQLFGMHAPNELAAVAMVDSEWTEEFDWLKWMPHTSTERNPFVHMPLVDSASSSAVLLAALEEYVLKATSEEKSRKGPYPQTWHSEKFGTRVEQAARELSVPQTPAIVVIVTDNAPVDRPRLMQVLERGAQVGVYGIFLADDVQALPGVARTYIDLTNGLQDATVDSVRAGVRHEHVTVEGVSSAYMEMLARRLAPVVDASTVIEDDSDIPRSVMFLSLTGHEVAKHREAVIDRWHENNTIIDRSGKPARGRRRAGHLRALVGQAAAGAMTLDLRDQGPHALVGGTTGAGKSEFLQAWVLGLATNHSPDRVTFLFVDYKGGSAFADCVELPHCVGLVTDLSPHLVHRALTSLRAELHYREHLFNRKKVKDLLELEKRQDPDTPPALVLVIDEFAALAKEVPEFVDGVVDIAQRGRSLGIHLIMATQRPAGVIKDNLRANTNLRVALRMADAADSKDVVDDPIASTFDSSTPGRAIAKTGPGRLTMFQSAYAGGWSSEEAQVAEVQVAELRFGGLARWESHIASGEAEVEDLGPTDQRRIVDTVVQAADAARIPVPRRPWLDELSTELALDRTDAIDDGMVPLGLADIPQQQEQRTIGFQADRDGSLLIYGTSGSGKTTALKTIAAAAGMAAGADVVVHGLDFASGALRAIEVLPHVSSVVPSDDRERTQRLLLDLVAELERRNPLFSEHHASNLTEYRETSGAKLSRVFLLLDGVGSFRDEWEVAQGKQHVYAALGRILAEGRPLGVHVVLTADRPGAVSNAMSANVSRRLVLRMSDKDAYAMLGAPKDVLDQDSVPGRGLLGSLEVQVATIGGSGNSTEQAKALAELAAELRDEGVPEVEPIGALPTRFDAQELPDQVDGLSVLGIAEDDLQPLGVDATGTFVVTGPPEAGKTNAIKALIQAVERSHGDTMLFHFGDRRSPLRDFRPWKRQALLMDDIKALAEELSELVLTESLPGKAVIVVEDVPQYTESPADRHLRKLIQAVNRSEHLLIGDGDVSSMQSNFGLMADFKALKRGIALRPDQLDGDVVFKQTFPRIRRAEFPPGRGMLVQGSRIATVHLPYVT